MTVITFTLTPETAWENYQALVLRKYADPALAKDAAFQRLLREAYNVLYEQFTPEGLRP